MTGAKLSLLIPAYNAARFLPRLLTSAHAQAIPFDEIWVYDDCSTDDTAAVADAYGAKLLAGGVNKGCSAGKNALAQHVQTDWLHFHDADDELLPNFVELAHKWMQRNSPDVVLFDYEFRDNETTELLARRSFDHAAVSADPRRYAIREQINPFCGLYRRDAYLRAGGYDEDPAILYNEDVAFHIKMAFAGLSFGAENTVSIINYRVGGSMSAGNQLKCLHAHHEVMQRTLARNDAGLYRADISQKLWAVAGRLAAFGEWDEADRAASTAAKYAPPTSAVGSLAFRLAAQLNPSWALRLRERWIRFSKPELRRA